MKQEIRNQLSEMYKKLNLDEPKHTTYYEKKEVFGHINVYSTHEHKRIVL